MKRLLLCVVGVLWLVGCGSKSPVPETAPDAGNGSSASAGKASSGSGRNGSRHPQVPLKRGGGFYKDDGPADNIPDNLDEVPDAVPRWEPIYKNTTKPYSVLGKTYKPYAEVRPYRVKGVASWYGKKFHGQKTSLGVPYDMFAMTAAHPVLAIPSYARVTSVQSGRSVVVRVIDRGPFHADRVIDLSYVAAYKLGLISNGSGEVVVEAIVPGEPLNTRYAEIAPPFPPQAPVAEPEKPAPEVLPHGVYLQLGAFANRDNAENLRNHLLRELDWINDPLRISVGGNIHRLQLGPYRTRSEAEAVVDRIRRALGYAPTIVTR